MNSEFEGPNVPFDEERHVRKAHRFEPHFCGHCPNVHIIFFDENDDAFCDVTLTSEQLRKLSEMRPPNHRG
jgi:hypothetical protein